MRLLDLSNVEESRDYSSLPAGGYICKIVRVTNVEDKEYLLVEFDIAAGDHKNYYTDLESAKGFWGGNLYRSYKASALPMFKRFCSAVTKSNPGYIFDGNQNRDESTLVGKLIGVVLYEEEYMGNDGNIKTSLKAKDVYSVDDIKKGNFKVPDKKKLPREAEGGEGFMTVPEGVEEIPFG